MSSKARNLVYAFAFFLTGVPFVYFSFPFFSSMITAMDSYGTASFEEWATVKLIVWGAYAIVALGWLIAMPAYFMFAQPQGDN